MVADRICDADAALDSSAGRVQAEDWRISSRESPSSSASVRYSRMMFSRPARTRISCTFEWGTRIPSLPLLSSIRLFRATKALMESE
ncbi:MAG TPA: hypothetical protein VN931_00030 [Fibrobacteria bacterium]|nr:hypothetical protein [Fibrobacteria bacterium]